MKNKTGSPLYAAKISYAEFSVLIKICITGFLLAETWYLASAVAKPLNTFVSDWRNEYKYLVLLIFYAALIPVFLLYLQLRSGYSYAKRLLLSSRFDVIALLLVGIIISATFDGVLATQYKKFTYTLSAAQSLSLFLTPIVLCVVLVARTILSRSRTKFPQDKSFFLNDTALKATSQDMLGFKGEAERFAERLLNGGANDSIVFGVDAPWGIGKSTFINFCIEYLENARQGDVIIYKFEPLRYEGQSNLPEKFIDGLVDAIQKNIFLPEIRPLVSRYSRFIKGKVGISLFGLRFDPSSYDVDDALEDLTAALCRVKKKIIVIVDDLDRVNFTVIKEVLFTIKKSFALPNVTYVLCYDTENIVSLEKIPDDAEKVREFLEKFVNVKVSLFLDTHTLSQYVSDNFEKAVQHNLQIDPLTLDKIKQAIKVTKDIYKSNDFHHYQSFLGDIRKIKRFINTLMLLEVEKTDFEISDFNKYDLLHLLLIYINYPEVFRKIYNTKTDGKFGFFSVVRRYDPGYPPDEGGVRNEGEKNSTFYARYIDSFDEESGQRFLLEKIFSVPERFKDFPNQQITDEVRSTYACFNRADSRRNLEQHLKLIVRQAKPQKIEHYRFYLQQKDKLAKGMSIHEILSAEEFSNSFSEETHQQFWRVVVNSAREFRGSICDQLITYLLMSFPKYSLVELPQIGLGFRDSASYLLIKLLDNIGWIDEIGEHVNNTDENVVRVADRILGEGEFQRTGVLDVLSEKERGIMGLFDLLLFRLQCSADRGGEIFNVTRALSLHSGPDAPTSGVVSEIAIAGMREISQKAYRTFEDQYIKVKKNIFDAIDSLALRDISGQYETYIEKHIQNKKITSDELEMAIARTRTRMKAFIAYQLGNKLVESGVGCGFYDETGKENKNGIANKINDYLFNECFNPAQSQKNYEHFLDYLLMNFANRFAFSDRPRYTFVPTIDEFIKVLNRNKLRQYWKENEKVIRSLEFEKRDKTIHAMNYSVSYKDGLSEIFKSLDLLLAEND